MFKKVLIAPVFLVLIGCFYTTEKRIVRITNEPISNDFQEGMIGCEWVEQSLSIFNQKDQKIIFNSSQCPGLKEIQQYGYKRRFFVEGRNYVHSERLPIDPKYQDQYQSSAVLGIWKLGVMTEIEFLESFIAPQSRDCIAGQIDDRTWRIGLSEQAFHRRGYKFVENVSIEPPKDLSVVLRIHRDDRRFPYAAEECSKLKWGWEFIFREGVVFGYSPRLANAQFYDFASITYQYKE